MDTKIINEVITLDEMFNEMEYVYDGHLPTSSSLENEYLKIKQQMISNVMYYLSDVYLPDVYLPEAYLPEPNDSLKYKYQLVLEHRGNLTNEQFEKYLETLPLNHELFYYIGYSQLP